MCMRSLRIISALIWTDNLNKTQEKDMIKAAEKAAFIIAELEGI